MSLSPFAFTHDRPLRTVIATLRGQWTMETVEAYKAAVLADMRATIPGQEPHNAVLDIRECGLHVRGVAEAMMDFRRACIPEMARIAIVSSSALDTLQIKRITAAREYGVFTTIEEARDWLGQVPIAAKTAEMARSASSKLPASPGYLCGSPLAARSTSALTASHGIAP